MSKFQFSEGAQGAVGQRKKTRSAVGQRPSSTETINSLTDVTFGPHFDNKEDFESKTPLIDPRPLFGSHHLMRLPVRLGEGLINQQ